jgi:hypothetical protein
VKRGKVKPPPPLLLLIFFLMLVNCLGMETNIKLVWRCEKHCFKSVKTYWSMLIHTGNKILSYVWPKH